METCLSEGVCPALAEVTQFPVQLPQGLPPLCLSFGMDQICQPLHFSQAQLPVGEGPPGELACLRWPQPWHPAWGTVPSTEHLAPTQAPGGARPLTQGCRLTQGLQDATHHRRASMHVELRAVLTRETLGTWCGEESRGHSVGKRLGGSTESWELQEVQDLEPLTWEP